ncbi:MAG: hypothetical protein M1818_000171 [Claussenomyces sp. TS43310]|nr:MAG: hypothetical protein M1818_000171 [Claussenomyces sp. TS43310]
MPDPIVTKTMCIFTLTSVFLNTHQFPSLSREITTPTLPAFISASLDLISSKAASSNLHSHSSVGEIVFEAFAALVPQHPAIFRPFARQINLAVTPYLAPTLCDHGFVSTSLRNSARRLHVIMHWTAAKNTSREEWGKAIRALIRDVHNIVDRVFRSVVEDWESTTGYVSQAGDVNEALCGDAASMDGLPAWKGIDAGIERLVGLLGLLEEYILNYTTTAVTIPLRHIIDLMTRLMSVTPPKYGNWNPNHKGPRLHPAVDRDEREGLWAGIGHVHAASIHVYSALFDRLLDLFMPCTQGCLGQITWTFVSGNRVPEFRRSVYFLLVKLLPCCGLSLTQSMVEDLSPIIISCCKDNHSHPSLHPSFGPLKSEGGGKSGTPGASVNANAFFELQIPQPVKSDESHRLLEAASDLLPLLFSDLPQQYLRSSVRVELDRTAIIANHKKAMLASVLNPFYAKSGISFPSILPYLCRAFPSDLGVECLLRPRRPLLQEVKTQVDNGENDGGDFADKIMEEAVDDSAQDEDSLLVFHNDKQHYELFDASRESRNDWRVKQSNGFGDTPESKLVSLSRSAGLWSQPSPKLTPPTQSRLERSAEVDIILNRSPASEDEGDETDDSNSSVHLVMDLSESESDDDI